MMEFDAGRKTALIRLFSAGVAELADAQDLGSCTERCRGSTPLSCTACEILLPFQRMKRMNLSNRFSSRFSRNLVLAAAVLLPGAIALGDTVYIQSTATGTPLKRDN